MTIAITSPTTLNLTFGTAVSVQLTATTTGSAAALEWAAGIADPTTGLQFVGALPRGVSLSATGLLSGTPRQSGAWTCSIAVGDPTTSEWVCAIFSGTTSIPAGYSATLDPDGANVDPSNIGALRFYEVVNALPRLTIDMGNSVLVFDLLMNNVQPGGRRGFIRIPASDAQPLVSARYLVELAALPAGAQNAGPAMWIL